MIRATRTRLRRLAPRTVRARLALLYAGWFFAAGAVLLAVTYGLVAHSLPATATPLPEAKAIFACKAASAHPPKPSVVKPYPVQAPADCRAVFAAGARAAAKNQRDRTLNDLLLYSGIGLAFTTVLAGLTGAFMAGRALRPVKAITAAARQASTGQLGGRLRLEGPTDELKELADTFDDMLDRLDAAFAVQRRFIADASHELRTPLAVMRTAVDVTLAKAERTPEQLEAMGARIRRAVDKADTLVEALLTLAMSERELGDVSVVDLATLAEDVLDDATADVAARRLVVETVLTAAPVRGNGILLERLVGNLVDNAVRYNTEGGRIKLTTTASCGTASLVVENSGHPVDEEAAEAMFEPFHRAAGRTATGGVGLGLAIVRSIAERHGGTARADARQDGGLVITVALPSIP